MIKADETPTKYKAVLKLPFRVMIVNKAEFDDQLGAQMLLEESYPQFPAFEVVTQDEVTNWKGTIFTVDTPKIRSIVWMLDVKSGATGEVRSNAIAASLTAGRERFKQKFGVYPRSIFIRSEDLPIKTESKNGQPAVNHWPEWLEQDMIRPFRLTPLHCTFALEDNEFLGEDKDNAEKNAEDSTAAE